MIYRLNALHTPYIIFLKSFNKKQKNSSEVNSERFIDLKNLFLSGKQESIQYFIYSVNY